MGLVFLFMALVVVVLIILLLSLFRIEREIQILSRKINIVYRRINSVERDFFATNEGSALHFLTKRLLALNQKAEEVQQFLDSLDSPVAQNTKVSTELNSELEKISKRTEAAQLLIVEVEGKAHASMKSVEVMKENIDLLSQQTQRLKAEIEALKGLQTSLFSTSEELQAWLAKFKEEKIENLTKAQENVAGLINMLREGIPGLQKRIRETEKKVGEIERKANSLSQSLEAVEAEEILQEIAARLELIESVLCIIEAKKNGTEKEKLRQVVLEKLFSPYVKQIKGEFHSLLDVSMGEFRSTLEEKVREIGVIIQKIAQETNVNLTPRQFKLLVGRYPLGVKEKE